MCQRRVGVPLLLVAVLMMAFVLTPVAAVASATSTSPSPASAPQSVTLTGLFQSAALSWAAPSSDGGAPITSYLIDLDDLTLDGTVQQVSLPTSTTTYTFNSLVTGHTYLAFVYALNSAGASVPGESGNVTLAPRSSNSGTVVGVASTPDGLGYYVATSAGYVYTFGDAQWQGDMHTQTLTKPIVGITLDKATGGYWLVGGDGGVFAFDAPFYGNTVGDTLACPIVGMAAAPSNNGYYLFGCDGGIYGFGTVSFYGSIYSYGNGSAQQWLGSPIVAGAVDPQGGGYWLVAQDNVVCTFGSVDTQINQPGAAYGWGYHGDWCWSYDYGGTSPIVAITPTTDGNGYWLTGSDGGVFTAGDANFYGSMGGKALNAPVDGMATPPPGASNAGEGYWLVGQDGGIFTFGDVMFDGSALLPPEGTVHEWGVDTTSVIDGSPGVAYSSIVSSAGTPAFIGQYLNFHGTISSCVVSGGTSLSASEVQDIHGHGSQVLLLFSPDYTDLTDVSGQPSGQCEAEAAIALAKSLGVPTGTAIFQDVEEGYSINNSYIQGWYDSFLGSPYQGGFYEDSYTGQFANAYCTAVSNNHNIADATPLYANESEIGYTTNAGTVTESDAPPWSGGSIAPVTPGCANQTVAWQYEERQFIEISGYPNIDLDEYNGAENLQWGP